MCLHICSLLVFSISACEAFVSNRCDHVVLMKTCKNVGQYMWNLDIRRITTEHSLCPITSLLISRYFMNKGVLFVQASISPLICFSLVFNFMHVCSKYYKVLKKSKKTFTVERKFVFINRFIYAEIM